MKLLSQALSTISKRNFILACIAIVLQLTLLQNANAQWSTNANLNTPVSTIVLNTTVEQQVISDGAGGSFILWRDSRGSTGLNVYAQRLNAAGVVQWTTNGVPVCNATGDQNLAQMVLDGSGGIIVTWQDTRNSGYDIYAQRLNAAGVAQWTTDGIVVSNATNNQQLPAITSDGAGGAIIAWADGRNISNNYTSIYAQRLNAAGVAQWTANGVAIYTAANGYFQYAPTGVTLLANGNGGAFICWPDKRNNNDFDLYAQSVNASGAIQWAVNGVAVCTSVNDQYNGVLVLDGAGGVFIDWMDGRSGTWNFYGQRLNSAGVAQWATNGVAVCNYTLNTNPRQNLSTISDGAGGVIATWQDYRTGAWDIYAQRINSSGVAQWTINGIVICNATNDQLYPFLITDTNGGAIITWQDYRSGSHIYAQRINSSGAAQWTANGVAVSLATAQAGQHTPVIDVNGAGGAIIVFNDDRQNIYYRSLWTQSVNADGTLGVASSNANLSSLTISAGTLAPTFATATTAYTASVSNATTTVTVTPTKADANATIQVRVNAGSYATVNSGSASASLALNVGSNTIDVKVTAENGTTINTYTITVTRNAPIPTTYTAINNGNWSTPATWQGGVVPPADVDIIIAANVNITAANVVVNNLTINSGATLTSSFPYGVNMNSGKTFTNNGTLGSLSQFTFLGSGLVAGSCQSAFNVVYINGAVDFGTTSSVANLTINTGGSVNTNRPTYVIGSSLNYNTGGTYVIGDEWVTGNTNYPRALTINAGTTLSFGNITTSRRVGGVNDAMNINGGLILSSAAGGDLIITSTYNNFNGTFTANGRTVTCIDGGSNCIVGGSQPVVFDNLVLNLPGKQFNLFTPITVTTSATFTAGYTQLNATDLIFNSGATITGASANCYVYTTGAGRLVMKGIGAGPVVAPIGRNIGNVFIHYNPVTITNGGGFDYAIKANATAPTGAGILDATKVIRCQWDIAPSGNATNVGLKFQYISGQGVPGGTFSETNPQRGLRYNTGITAWETIGTAIPVGTNPYTVFYIFSGATWGLFSFESVPPPPQPPTITSFTPTSGVVGTPVTITGTNFNTTPANNIVFFGATRAIVSTSTTTSLTVTVPVGATFDNITVVNMGSSLLAHSNANFTPTFTPNKNSIAITDFDPKIEIATGTGTTWPYQVALGDIDGDGKADLVVANRANSTVAVFRNTSTSGTVSFATRVDFSVAQEPRGLALVDLDGDGKLDIATTGGNLNQVAFTVLRNTSTSGAISFATKLETNTTAATYSIASADIDGDGKEDLIFGGPKMIIYPNTSTSGNITFAAPIDYTAAVNVNAIAIADIDGDAKKDICFTAGANVSVFRNTSTSGSISLATKVDFAAPQAYGITIGDWDGDGKLDIAASLLNTSNTLSILTNTSTVGNISFATRIDNSSPQNPYFVAGGDLNGDGKADLVTTNAGQNGTAANLSVYRNTSTSGAASFASNVNLALGSWPYYAAIGDIDGDGRPDIVSSSVEANRVAIFRNNPQFQTVVATGTLTAFAGCSGSASASQSFTVSGTALTANLVVTAPTGYEVSTTAGSGYASSVILTPASGIVVNTTIYVRLAATATGTLAGNITIASTGATTQNVAVTGTVNTLPSSTITASGPTSLCTGGSVTLNAPTTNTGGNAINITGAAGNYITVPHSTSNNLGAGTTYTIEAWIKVTDATNNTIVDKGDYNFLFQTHSNGNQGLGLYNRSFGWIYSAGTIPTNQWVHVAVTYNNRAVTFYKDGVVQGTYTASTNSTGDNGVMTIGRQSPTTCACNIFDGSMDELRLWNVAKTQTEIQASMNSTVPANSTGLAAYYKFDEGAGSAVADATANANNGTVVNTASWMVPSTSPLGGTSGPTLTYLWSPGGATTSSITATAAGNYTVTVNSSNGCSATSAATVVSINPLPTATITAGGATTFCTGGSVTLTASAGSSYLWSNGATTQAITVTTAGSYNVRVTNATGCFATSANTVVTVNPLPVATITTSGPTTFCTGGAVTLTTSPGASYLWSTGSTAASINVTTAGSYTVSVTNVAGCVATSSATVVTVNPRPVASISSASTVLCGPTATLILTATGGTSYQWSIGGSPIVGATAATYTANAIGTYTATATNAQGCTAPATGSIVLTRLIAAIPAFSFDSYCINTPISFTNQTVTTGAGTVSYAWSDNLGNSATTTNTSLTYANTGSYNVKLRVQSTVCTNLADSITRTVAVESALPATRYTPVDAAINDDTQLQARNFGTSYTWIPSTGLNNAFTRTPIANIAQQQQYRIAIRVPSGCVTVDTVLVRVHENYTVYVPNVFTPNGDGRNDKVIILPVGITQLRSFRIYNRWNKKVFETSDINGGWDGKVDGVLQPMDTYVWKVEAIAKDGNLIAKTGSITLLR